MDLIVDPSTVQQYFNILYELRIYNNSGSCYGILRTIKTEDWEIIYHKKCIASYCKNPRKFRKHKGFILLNITDDDMFHFDIISKNPGHNAHAQYGASYGEIKKMIVSETTINSAVIAKLLLKGIVFKDI